MPSIRDHVEKLRTRPLSEVLAVYIGASFAVLQSVAVLVDHLDIPGNVFRGTFALLALGLAAVLVARIPRAGTVRLPHVTRPTWRVAATSAVSLFALIGVAATVNSVTGSMRERNAAWVRSSGHALLAGYIEAQAWDSAWAVSERILRLSPDDPVVAERRPEYAVEVAARTEPAGASVLVRPFTGADTTWRPLGSTPIAGRWLPNGYYRIRIEKDGYEPVLIAGSPSVLNTVRRLHARGSIPEGMVAVAARPLPYVPSLPEAEPGHTLPAFFIDRYEVTNAQFRRFVDAGGYRDPRFWTDPFIRDGVVIPFDSAVQHFTDSTRRPGPRTWEAGDFPPGTADHPVAGVSWYEAAAYARFAGKSLPSIYEWYAAAGVSQASSMIGLVHFEGSTTRSVHASEALSPVGAFDMGGNVREWVHNKTRAEHFIMGGAVGEVDYMFSMIVAASPWDRDPGNGFRLVQRPPAADHSYQLGSIDRAVRDFATEPAVSDDAFAAYRRMFAYDALPLHARVERADSLRDVARYEDVTVDAPYGGRARARLLLPSGRGPHPLVIWLGGTGMLSRANSDDAPYSYIDFLLRSGYAAAMLVPEGTYERMDSTVRVNPTPTKRYANTIVRWTQDLSRIIDYAATRPDIDTSRVAYMGTSLGARLAPIFLAVEPRIRTAVLFNGGFNSGVTLPEVEPVNYIGHVGIPVLMLNGRYDVLFTLEWQQRPMFQRLGTPPEHKRHLVFNSGHAVPRADGIRETLNWLEIYLPPGSHR